MTSIKLHNILGLLLWFSQSLVAVVLQNLTLRWKRMEILWGERADGVFTFKSNYSSLFRGRAKQSRNVGVWIPGEEGAWALLSPDPCTSLPHSQQAPTFPGLGWVWHLWHFSHHLRLPWRREIWREFCYLLWKTTAGHNQALSGYTGVKNVIFAVGFIPHIWVLLFSSRLKASTQPSHLKKQWQWGE